MTLDKFVRSLEPETDYYISQRTVLMHKERDNYGKIQIQRCKPYC